MTDIRYLAPQTLDEAVGAFAAATGAARILAGGTDLLVQMRSGMVSPGLIVDIKKIPEMMAIEETADGGFKVGAAVSGAVLAEHPGVRAVASTEALVAGALDVYAPCAMGGAITDEVVDTLSAKVVCGAANNQLAHPGVEKHLMDAGITYAPDYVVNAGGLIQVADELDPRGFSFERAQQRASGILETTRRILALADDERVSPAVAADRIAEERIRSVGRLRSIWVG